MFSSFARWFRRQSVARKLTATAVFTTAVTLLGACTFFAMIIYAALRFRLVLDVTMLTFKDAAAASDTLRATAINEHILDAQLFTRDGTLLASYMRPGVSPRAAGPGDARRLGVEGQ